MKLVTKENSINYAATVVEIKNLHAIEVADRIQRCVLFNNNVVVSKDVKVGDVMLYFVSGTKLSEELCKANNLYSDSELNADKTTKSYIGKQSRVKAIKLKGIISDGILLPLNCLNYAQITWRELQVGDTFTDIGDVSICEKYFVPVRSGGGQGKQKKTAKISRMVDKQFYFHNDTDNFRKNTHKINPNDIIGIHYKKHGTSVIISNIPVKRKLKWYESLAQFSGLKVNETEYDIVYASRRVVKNGYLNTNPNSFYKTDIWGDVAKEIGEKIPKNWTVYGEILGYTKDGGAIQKGYDYGCMQGEHKFYVYRVTVVNADGIVVELTDKQIEEFCEKNGLLYKDTFIYYGLAANYMENFYVSNPEHDHKENEDELRLKDWQEQFLAQLEKEYNEKDCYMCTNKVPEEGIIIRKESAFNYEAYKLKSKRFILAESDSQEKGETNIEDNDGIDEQGEGVNATTEASVDNSN